jgi:polyisoprenoid-binding protein YceI
MALNILGREVHLHTPSTGTRAALATVFGLLILAPSESPGAESPTWHLGHADVRIVVPLKPGGAFEAKTTSLGGTLTLGSSSPVLLKGEISVDLTSLDTGIDLRNQHLRQKYLEISRGPGFDHAVLSELRLDQADGEGFQGKTGFAGKLLLHGVSRDITGTAEIRKEGPETRVEARFPLTLTDFGIEPPEYLGVGVASKLLVKVRFNAIPGSTK